MGIRFRGLVAVFMTVSRCSYCSVVAKISTCARPCLGRRRNAPWWWRRDSSDGSGPSWSIASIQRRATLARKSWSFSSAVRARAYSISVAFSGLHSGRTFATAIVMIPAERDPITPDASAAAVSPCRQGPFAR
ncbi:hypothetical protein AHiyo8_65500 [Arthrobacter sp. Hiyo8]|nr:hypothetical protein AHiyo8_65500 [Arthrobacter sp. Hiyo8]